MKPQDPGAEEYFDDGEGGEFITRRGAAVLLGYAEGQSVTLATVFAAGKRPRAPRRRGRPVKSLVRLDDVMKLAQKRGRTIPTNVSQAAPVRTGSEETQQTAAPVSSMEEAKLRRQLEALARENAKLKQRLGAVEPLLGSQMDTIKRLLELEDGTSSA